MKKVLVFILTLLIYSNVYADLTDSQAEKVAKFAKNFIVTGMSQKHVDSSGMPILCYGQGPARVEGYQEKLSYVKNDYSSSIVVNSNKWNFDCASFVSYVLKKTLNLTLLDSLYLGGNPYMVSNYADDRDHFITIGKNVMDYQTTLNNINLYKPGDLIVVVGSHIGMYTAHNEVAEFSSYQIGTYSNKWTKYRGSGKYNLGSGIISLSEFLGRNSSRQFMVLRIKNGVVSNSLIPNTIVTWPDTREIENLVLEPTPTPKLAKDSPKITLDLSTTKYVSKTTLNAKINDEDGLVEYKIYLEDKVLEYVKLDKVYTQEFNYDIKENGKYTVYAKDSFGKETKQMINIDNIDSTSPIIESASYNNYSIIVFANDGESGLSEKAYSFDNCVSWQSENKYKIDKNGQYVVCVKDRADNVSKKVVNVIEIKEEKESKPVIIDNDPKEDITDTKDDKSYYIIISVIVIIMIVILLLVSSMIRKKDKNGNL